MQINTPDIGVEKAIVSEILIQVGDQIAVDDSLLVLESDKATVEVPSTATGTVKQILVKQGDEVKEGVPLVEIESELSTSSQPVEQKVAATSQTVSSEVISAPETPVVSSTSPTESIVVDVKVPDIGVEKAIVAEILLQVGDTIEINQSIVVVESDKATVEVPCPISGSVESIDVKVGDQVKEGVVLIHVKTDASNHASVVKSQEKPQAEPSTTAATTQEVTIPDLGVEKALVAEVLVQVGDHVEKDQSLVVVESDKATVEVPSPFAGIIQAIHLQSGQQVSKGAALATIKMDRGAAGSATSYASSAAVATASQKAQSLAAPSNSKGTSSASTQLTQAQEAENAKVYAGPAVRKLARELGVILSEVKASGEHGRIIKEDVFAYVKTRLTSQSITSVNAAPSTPSGLPALPDFSGFGGGELKAMTRLQQVSVPQLSLNNYIPQVTQFDSADITDLEAWRNELKEGFKKQGISLTILAFIAKAVAHLLKEEPYFAGHLADDQKSVLLRHEIHMGIAVATADGLTVPVLRNPDQKSVKQIAEELAILSQKARDKKLAPKDLQGANFTITSLGSIGGTAFTPLVNWPQVAILGISPASMQPVWNGKEFTPRLKLPLSLSYDHRVINGADAARFTHKLTLLLQDIRSLLL